MAASLAGVAGRIAGTAEAVVGAGLLVLVADLPGQAERGGVLGTGEAGLAGCEEDFAQAVERLGFRSGRRSRDTGPGTAGSGR